MRIDYIKKGKAEFSTFPKVAGSSEISNFELVQAIEKVCETADNVDVI